MKRKSISSFVKESDELILFNDGYLDFEGEKIVYSLLDMNTFYNVIGEGILDENYYESLTRKGLLFPKQLNGKLHMVMVYCSKVNSKLCAIATKLVD